MSSSEILFTNAAIQNRDFSFDEKPEKAVGILAAHALNHLHGNEVDVHCWNNVGLFDSEQSASVEERLKKKYTSDFAKYIIGGDLPETVILTDDQDEFTEWAIPTIDSMLSNGSVYIEEAEFHHCTGCDITIAEKAVDIDECKTCKSSGHLEIITELGMFTDTPEDRRLLLPQDLIFNQINLRQEQNSLMQISPRLLLSRTRGIGVPLDAFGLRDQKLDPRLGIGMLSIFAASNLSFQATCIVQSISTLNRIVPYLRSAIPNPEKIDLPEYQFAFHGRISPQLLRVPGISPSLLALYSLGRRNEISSADTIVGEISKLERCMVALDNVSPPTESNRQNLRPQRNLSNIVATTAKDIGKLLEKVKHGRIPTKETLAEIDAARTVARHILGINRN